MCWRLPNSDEEANRIIQQMNEKRYGKFAEEAPDGEDFEEDVKTGFILTDVYQPKTWVLINKYFL